MSLRNAALIFFIALAACGQRPTHGGNSLAQKQAEVVDRGRSVMPFDIARTMHHFRKSPSGGVEEVLSTDGDARQVALVRQHLKDEALRFQRGDFSDPGRIHGSDMPGLKAIAAGASRVAVRYSDTPSGAQIVYTSADPSLVAAIHAWFNVQVREHGQHAMPM